MKEKIYVVMPAYNEEENIENVIEQWYPILENGSEDSRIVIADAGSTDKTHEKLLSLQESGYSKLEIVEGCKKQHGPKIMYLYKYAIENGADWIFQTDSDGQTNPEEFDKFWNNRKKYDAVLGCRRERGDGKARAFVEKIVCILLRIYYGVKIPDANAPYRLMNTRVVQKYIDKMPDDYNLPNIMFTTYFVYYKEKVSFEDISFKPRQGGVNSINIPKIAKIGWKALKDFRFFKKGMIKNDTR